MLATRFGVDWDLENQATHILVEDRKATGGWRFSDWLTDVQIKERQQREVYTSIGYPEPNIVEGRAFRAYNPLFGNRPRRPETADV